MNRSVALRYGDARRMIHVSELCARGIRSTLAPRRKKASETMELRFIRGVREAPRGHAIIIVRPASGPALATYCVVLPITFSIGRYIPPILASQLPMEGLRDMGNSPGVMPVPPMMEDIEDADALIGLAELRDDDVVEISGLSYGQENQRMELAALTSAEYHELYQRYTAKRQPPSHTLGGSAATRPLDMPPQTPIAPEDDPLSTLLADSTPGTEREYLSEVATLIGTLRYAQEGHDERLLTETKRSLRRASAPLPDKYRAEDLINAALIPGERGQRLTELYLTRAYRLLAEDYSALAEIEQQIQELS